MSKQSTKSETPQYQTKDLKLVPATGKFEKSSINMEKPEKEPKYRYNCCNIKKCDLHFTISQGPKHLAYNETPQCQSESS